MQTPTFAAHRLLAPVKLVAVLVIALAQLGRPVAPAFAQMAGASSDRSAVNTVTSIVLPLGGSAGGQLVGPEWHWRGTQFSDGTAFIPGESSRYWLTFTADGTAQVRADCNSGNGPYTVSGDQIQIQILAMTQAFCPPPSLSDTFVEQVGQVSHFSVRGLELLMEFPADSGTMRFAAPIDTGASPPADTGGSDTPALEGTPWTLVQYAGPDGSTQTVLADTEITAQFEEGRVSGSSGCNSYGGAYTLDGNTITISGVISTLRACLAPGVMEQEGAYLGALLGVAAYEVSGDTLILRDGAGAVVLTYVLQAQTPLEGTTWIAEAYNNGRGGVVSVLGGTQLTALFDGGRLTGSAGCNSYMTSYTASGSAIEIGLAATTRLFCATPDGVMEQEAAYLAALPTAAAYRIDGNRMILERADGARVASFTPMDGGLAPETPITGSGKITFDLASIDEAGLTGPPDGQVAVAYEFCIPATTDRLTEVQSIDPTVQAQGGAPGRIGCGPDELLCIGSTHQANWRSVLEKLATLDYVSRIDRSFAE